MRAKQTQYFSRTFAQLVQLKYPNNDYFGGNKSIL